jgi:hypothetical protein
MKKTSAFCKGWFVRKSKRDFIVSMAKERPRAYQWFMKKHEKHIEEEKLIRVPASLDLTPYRNEKDFGLMQRLIRRRDRTKRPLEMR